MNEAKDEMLTDAIKTALQYSYTIIKLKRVIFGMGIVIISLICGYFI